MDISVFRFYKYIKNMGKISIDNENYSKFMKMFRKTKKNDKISNNTHVKAIL